MRRLAAVFVLGLAAWAYAQDCVPPEVSVTVRSASVDFLPDGGCLLYALASSGVPGYSVEAKPYSFNGARCGVARAAALAAAKLDFGTGDGGRP